MKTLTFKSIATFAILDLLFNPLVTAAYIQLLGFTELERPFLVFAAAWIAKVGACALFLSSRLRPVDAYLSRRQAKTPQQLLACDNALQNLAKHFGLFYAFTWSLTYLLGFIAIRWVFGDLELDPRSTRAVALVVVAVWFGGFAFGFPLVSMLTSDAAGTCSVDARNLRLNLDRPPTSLQSRIGVIALALGLGPTLWMTALGYMKQIDAHLRQGATEASLIASQLAHEYDNPDAEFEWPADERWDTTTAVVRYDGTTVRSTDGKELELTPAALAWLSADHPEPSARLQQMDAQRVTAFTRIDDNLRAVAVVNTGANSPGGFILSAVIFAVVVGLWAPLCAVALGRSVSGPLQRLTASAREIVEEGKQSQMTALPVARDDEVGVLSERFNELIDMMRDLSQAADAIASGDLRVSIDRKGELPDAFRHMLDSLRAMVSEIRETSVTLASAATEIFAASQEQEAAATQQSSAMEEISRTMDSLSESAAHVSDAVQGVLTNAEKTLDNTDSMVNRIGQLSGHAGRIGEILDIIREIAERSDLLALNGSLEASRAGEGGQGFALVASEMRRLAERVTASVHDIKKLVTDIRSSGSTTVMATEESRRLAEGTTQAARQITFVSQQQRSGTEQVSQSVKNIAEVVTQSVSATAQTRTSAESLKFQADRLAQLVRKFEVQAAVAE